MERNTKQISVRINDRIEERIDDIKQESGHDNRSEVIRNAVILMHYLLVGKEKLQERIKSIFN